jgi:thiamine biosynthesis lipoprotein
VRWPGISCAFALALGPCGADATGSGLAVEGVAMGTTYSARIGRSEGGMTRPQLEGVVRRALERVDALMSTYREDSELERFNRHRGTEWVAVSSETAHVAHAALDLAARSGGVFDPTVGPLVRLWGFGSSPPVRVPPAADQVIAARAAVGFRHLGVRQQPPALRKDRPALGLDLSGIAKGYAVDAIAERLIERGVSDLLVEIGGEIRARGVGPRGGPWIIEIEDPLARPEDPPALVALRDVAIATSGPYRNFLVRQGMRLSHVVDPRSGAPVASQLISVSVIAPSAMQADGWATALLVAGPDAGWELARREGLAALFVSAHDGSSRRRATRWFDAHWSDRSPLEETQP